jgi:GxxExxY protein
VSISVHQWLKNLARHTMNEPLYKEESQQIVGCAMEVLNELGHGFHEKPYENALVIEFQLRGIPFRQQAVFDILYKTRKVGDYIPDLIVFDKIVVDAKVIEKITDREIGQMMNYLKITGLRLGYILNFKNPKLEWRRVVR